MAIDRDAGPDAAAQVEGALTSLELRGFALIAALLVLAITLPYLWAWQATPHGMTFGGLLYRPEDQNVHLAWARQAREGSFFFRDAFTHESLGARQFFTNLFAWALGTLARLTSLPLLFWHHAARVLFAVLTLWWFFRLCAAVTASRHVRLIALSVAAFGGGAGWLQPWLPGISLLDSPGLDAPMATEAFLFTSSFVFALHTAALACLCLIFTNLLQAHAAPPGQAKSLLFRAGAAAFVLANIHTYAAVPLWFIMLGWSVYLARRDRRITPAALETRRWMGPVVVLLCMLPPVLYQFWVFQVSPEFRLKALTATPAPSPLDVLLTFGLLWPFVLIGAWTRRREPAVCLLLMWVGAILSCIYLPVSFAGKMIEGLYLPLAVLASIGLVTLVARLSSRAGRTAVTLAVLLLWTLSSAQFVHWCLAQAADNNRSQHRYYAPPLYLPQGEMTAMHWLGTTRLEMDRAILCLPYVGNYLPRESNRTVFLGHWGETLNSNRKTREALHFYRGELSPAEALSWLRRNRIGLVYMGFYERQARRQATVNPLAGLETVYSHEGVRIGRVPR